MKPLISLLIRFPYSLANFNAGANKGGWNHLDLCQGCITLHPVVHKPRNFHFSARQPRRDGP